MGRLWAVGLTFGILMASGCAGPPSTPTDSLEPSAEPSDRGTTGMIAGIVADEEQVPVAGAAVGVKDVEGGRAVTDAAGRFRIGNVPAGSVTLVIEKAGYLPTRLDVTVSQDETSDVVVTLQAMAAPVPYQASYVADAIIELGVNALGVYYYDNRSGTQYRDIFYPIAGDVQTAVAGLQWAATSPASAKWMYLSLFLSDAQCVSWCKLVAERTGRSPLVTRADHVSVTMEGRANVMVNPYLAIQPPCTVATVPTCSSNPDAVVQVALDQRFRLYTVVFFVDPAPTGFNPLPGGS